ncbi:MAG: hypothetical protein V4813_08870 [Gemmatimonadota bacterium]
MSVTIGVLLQIAVSVQVADTVAARTAVPVVVRATVNGNTAPRITAPTANGTSLELVSDVTRLGGGFGQAVATRETRYVLRAGGPGLVVLSPVMATIGTLQAISQEKRVVVLPPPTNAVPALVTQAPLSRRTLVNFHSLVTSDTAWAGQQVTLQVGVFIDDELRAQLQRNPEYVAPSVDGAVSYDLPVANDALPSRDVDGARYRPFIFARALFPLRAGLLTIPPARLGYTLGSAGTMFGRQERQTASTPTRSVVVRELPVEGRPPQFGGAVGVYAISASVERGGRVGDALQLSVTVTGAGNVKLLPAPTLSIPGITINPSGESIVVDSTDLLIRGSKTFRFLLTPTRDGDIPLGDVRYAYFNPVRATYEEAIAPLGSLRVAPGTAVADEERVSTVTALPLEAWRVEDIDDITERWWFRVLFLLLGAPWLALMLRRLYRALPRRPSRERRKQRRDPAAVTVVDAATLRRTFLRALAPLVQLRADQPFAVDDVVRRLRRSGASTDAAEAAGALLLRLDRLTFSTAEPLRDEMLAQLEREAAAVTTQLQGEMSSRVLEKMRPVARSIILVIGAASVLGAQPAAFTRGIAEYRARRFTEAAASFADAAATQPASATAWSNLAAAHWMRADTAGAITAWQRSARLAPRGSIALSMLQRHATTGELRTAIVPVTPNVAWWLLLGVTGVLSLAGAAWRWRQRAIGNGALIGAACVVAGFAALSVVSQRSANADGIVVVRRDVALRTEPVLAGEAGARARAGELAIVREARGTWRLLDVRDGRSGWVESEALRSLAIGDGRDVALAERRIAADGELP